MNKEDSVYAIKFYSMQKQIDEKQQEIERLNNIIDKFDKWLLGEKMLFYRGSDDERLIRYYETKNKWLKLKEGK